jgi:hypothetical protein
MPRFSHLLLLGEALTELFIYDLIDLIFGFRGVMAGIRRTTKPAPEGDAAIDKICRAVDTVSCFYFRPVRCLQRSVVIARMLRKHGSPAKLVVGYCAIPFRSHAWVEINGNTIHDTRAYRDKLQILLRA